MSPDDLPASDVRSGPIIADHETLFRALTHPSWYIEEENRPSSAAFKFPLFSVDIASRIGNDPIVTAKRFSNGTGVVEFNSGAARELGCDPRDEGDVKQPHNLAHGHVYMPQQNSKRKTVAKKLVSICKVLIPATFAEDQ